MRSERIMIFNDPVTASPQSSGLEVERETLERCYFIKLQRVVLKVACAVGDQQPCTGQPGIDIYGHGDGWKAFCYLWNFAKHSYRSAP